MILSSKPLILKSILAIPLLLCACQEKPPEPAPSPPPITPLFLEPPRLKPLQKPVDMEMAIDAPAQPIEINTVTLRQQRGTIIKRLKQGRAMVRAGKFEQGIALYQEALLIDPNHAQLLSELGWAAFKHNDMKLAEHATTLSVRHAHKSSVKGASLYNLGRIAETHKRFDIAASHYQESLRVRPHNATVKARLDHLTNLGSSSHDSEECVFIAHRSDIPSHQASPLELCQAYTQSEPHACSNIQPHHEPVFIGDFTLSTFAVEPEDDQGHTRFIYLSVRAKDTWYTNLLGIEYNPGMGYIHESLSVQSISKTSTSPQSEQALVLLTHAYTDGDYPRNEAVTVDIELMSMLDLSGPQPQWLGSALKRYDETLDKMLDEEDGIDHGANFPRSSQHHYDISWGRAHFTTRVKKGRAHARYPAGKFSYKKPPELCPSSYDFLF